MRLLAVRFVTVPVGAVYEFAIVKLDADMFEAVTKGATTLVAVMVVATDRLLAAKLTNVALELNVLLDVIETMVAVGAVKPVMTARLEMAALRFERDPIMALEENELLAVTETMVAVGAVTLVTMVRLEMAAL